MRGRWTLFLTGWLVVLLAGGAAGLLARRRWGGDVPARRSTAPSADREAAELLAQVEAARDAPARAAACEAFVSRFPTAARAFELTCAGARARAAAGDVDTALTRLRALASGSGVADGRAHAALRLAGELALKADRGGIAVTLWREALNRPTTASEALATLLQLVAALRERGEGSVGLKLLTVGVAAPLPGAGAERRAALECVLEHETGRGAVHPRALAAAHATLGERARAEASWARIPDAERTAADRLARGRNLEALKRTADAERCYAALVARSPDDPLAASALYRLGRLRAGQRDRLADARAAFEGLVTRFPADARAVDAWLALGDLAVRREDYPAARRAYGEVLARSQHPGKRSAAGLSLGWALLREGRAADAVTRFAALVEAARGERRLDALWGLARAREQAGDVAGARAALERLIAQAGAGRRAERARRRLASLAGR